MNNADRDTVLAFHRLAVCAMRANNLGVRKYWIEVLTHHKRQQKLSGVCRSEEAAWKSAAERLGRVKQQAAGGKEKLLP